MKIPLYTYDATQLQNYSQLRPKMASFFRSIGEVLYYPFRSQESKVKGSGSHPQGIPWSYSSALEFNSWYEREIVGNKSGYGLGSGNVKIVGSSLVGSGMQDFKEECGRAVDKVVRILHQRMPLKVGEVIKVLLNYYWYYLHCTTSN